MAQADLSAQALFTLKSLLVILSFIQEVKIANRDRSIEALGSNALDH